MEVEEFTPVSFAANETDVLTVVRPRSPCDEVTAAEAASAVRAAIRQLPDGQRRVVELAYFKGLTCREVALAPSIREGTAKSRLRLALAKLETVLDKQLLESS